MCSSPRPAFGPEPIQRRSFEIFVRLTASTFSTPDASTSPSRAPWASKWSAASTIGRPVVSARIRITFGEKPFGVLMPVPVAVPPSGTSASRGTIVAMRSSARRIWRA